MQPVRLDVNAGSHTSTIWIGEGVSERTSALLDAAGVGARRFVVTSSTVWRLHSAALQAALGDTTLIIVSDGERFKTLHTASRIYEALIRGGADRGSAIVGVGGGVIGDVAGFVAATYLRGITLVHVPTTLLAQVDSAVGGKVGVNHALGKNLIGAFHQPAAVITDPRLLDTLPRRELRAGLYEVVKYGVIASRALFELLVTDLQRIFARDPDVMIEIVAASCRIKADVVGTDEREADRRRVLNFGHTAGHALEAVTRYRRLRHGEAVAYGMLVAAELGAGRGLLDKCDHTALTELIARMGPLPSVTDLSASEVLETMKRDKKVVAGRLHMVLPDGLGGTVIVDDVTEKETRRALTTIGVR